MQLEAIDKRSRVKFWDSPMIFCTSVAAFSSALLSPLVTTADRVNLLIFTIAAAVVRDRSCRHHTFDDGTYTC